MVPSIDLKDQDSFWPFIFFLNRNIDTYYIFSMGLIVSYEFDSKRRNQSWITTTFLEEV